MIAVIGLGNPGKQYEETVHNIGFLILDTLLRGELWEDNKYAHAQLVRTDFVGAPFVFVKPITFMNESGKVIPFLKKNYEIGPDNLVVIHDDIDLPFGTIKVQYDRGSGGHNGVKSIVDVLGTQKFVRIKVGVARVFEDGVVRKPDVLASLMTEEKNALPDLSVRVGKILETIALSGVDTAMTLFN